MKDPFEYVSRDYLPWMKGLISVDLSSKGYSQSRISSLIGLTQPSVNYYLKRNRALYLQKLEKIGLSRESITEQESKFIEALSSPGADSTLKVIETVVEALASGELCEYHRRAYHLPADCDACMKLWGSGSSKDRSGVLRSLDEAVAVLEASESFPALIPEVRTNFVYAARDARTVKDVAGIEGRIVKLRGRAKALTKSEYGASRHLSSVLLAVRGYFPELACAMNVKLDQKLRYCIEKFRWNVVQLPKSDESDAIVRSVEKSISGLKRPPDALLHGGGVGLEPATYVLGVDPGDVLGKVLVLADEYKKHLNEQKHNFPTGVLSG
jgi:predicted fused transcriptional regulator/phosphomethylpyrimidine kinase/predicted transcriptional regulator